MKELVLLKEWQYKSITYQKGDKVFLSEKRSKLLIQAKIAKFAKQPKINKNASNDTQH